MTVLMYTLGVVLFVVGVAASIGLHEAGHMVPAKKFGVKVTQYFIGFGRTVWSRRRGETEYASRRSRSAATSSSSGCCRPARRTTRAGSASPTPACSPS